MADKTPMPYDWDVIKISYCRKHKEYWVTNCPECMAEDTLIEGIEKGRQMERERILGLVLAEFIGADKDGKQIDCVSLSKQALKEGKSGY